MGGIANSNDTPTSLYQTDAYTAQLINLADEKNVAIGPGGAAVVIDKDSMVGIPPSQQGIARSDIFRTLSHDPLLSAPLLSLLYEAKISANFHYKMEIAKSLIEQGYALFGMDMSASLKTSKKEDTDDDELAIVLGALDEFEASGGDIDLESSENPAPPRSQNIATSPLQADPFESFFTSLDHTSSTPEYVSSENKQLLSAMSSKDATTVTAALLEQAGISDDDASLSPEDLKMLKEQVGKLGAYIAQANQSGGAPILGLAMPALLLASFSITLNINQQTSLSPDQKELLASKLYTAAQSIASANLQSITSRESPSEAFVALSGTDASKIQNVFQGIVDSTALTGFTPDEKSAIQQYVGDLSQKLADHSYDPALKNALLSNDPAVVAQALSLVLPTTSGPGVGKMLPILSKGVADINSQELSQMLKGNSHSDISTALGVLSGVTTSPALPQTVPPKEKKFAENYLQALTQALVFLAQVRSLITRIEGEFTQELAASKMNTISDQTKTASALYLEKSEEIQKKYLANMDQIHTSEVMKYLMPVITIALMIASVVILAASLAAAIPTGGASAVAGVAAAAQIIATSVALAATTAVLVYTVADAISSWTTNQSLLERAFHNVRDETARKAMIAGVNTAIIVGAAILTLGVGIGTTLAMSVNEGVQLTLRMALETAMQLIKSSMSALFKGPMFVQMVGLLLGSVLSSGIIQDVLTKVLKAAGCDDKQAMIGMTVMMFLIMALTVALTSGKELGTFIKSGVSGIASGVKNVFSDIKELFEGGIQTAAQQLFQRIKDSLKELFASIGNGFKKLFDISRASEGALAGVTKASVESVLDASVTAVEKIFKRMIEMTKENPLVFAQIFKFLGGGLQIASQAVQAYSSAQQAQINTALAKLEREITALESMSSYLNSVGLIGQNETLNELSKGAEERFKQWKDLCNMVAQFIMDATQLTSELHGKAG